VTERRETEKFARFKLIPGSSAINNMCHSWWHSEPNSGLHGQPPGEVFTQYSHYINSHLVFLVPAALQASCKFSWLFHKISEPARPRCTASASRTEVTATFIAGVLGKVMGSSCASLHYWPSPAAFTRLHTNHSRIDSLPAFVLSSPIHSFIQKWFTEHWLCLQSTITVLVLPGSAEGQRKRRVIETGIH
jgi:hypothetical protein